jgi:hypothetical protein
MEQSIVYFEKLGREYCNRPPQPEFDDWDTYSKVIALVSILPFALLILFEKRLKKHMDYIFCYIMFAEVAVGQVFLQRATLCTTEIYADILRVTFLEVLMLEPSKEHLQGMFLYCSFIF